MSINIYKKIKYENMPGETASHWSTPVYLFDEPVSLKLGEKIKIKASSLMFLKIYVSIFKTTVFHPYEQLQK